MKILRLMLILIVCVGCAIAQPNAHLILSGSKFNKYNWTKGQRYHWAARMNEYALRKVGGTYAMAHGGRLIYCLESDPQYRIIMFHVLPDSSFFNGQPMGKFLYERGFTKVILMDNNNVTHIDTYDVGPTGMQLGDPYYKKHGTLLGPGKYVTNTGTAQDNLPRMQDDNALKKLKEAKEKQRQQQENERAIQEMEKKAKEMTEK